MKLYIFTKFQMQISMTVLNLQSGHDFETSQGHYSEKKRSSSNGSYLMLLYICTKFHENILNGIKIIERERFS